MSDAEGPDVTERGTPAAGANRVDLAGSAIWDGIFLQRLEGPRTPGAMSYIGYELSYLDRSFCSV